MVNQSFELVNGLIIALDIESDIPKVIISHMSKDTAIKQFNEMQSTYRKMHLIK